MSEELRDQVRAMVSSQPPARLTEVVRRVGWARSSFFYQPRQSGRRRGPAPRPLDPELSEVVKALALRYPRWGYKRLAVVARRHGIPVSNRFVYRVLRAEDLLLRRPAVAPAELYQAARLFELLPQRPNDLWQADVTYIHIPGHGWWYAVTVIDYFSRYLLALHLSPSHDARAVMHAFDLAREEAERLHGPLEKPPFLVTDNGSAFVSKHFRRGIEDLAQHVRIRYRTPEQLGVLERFHQTLKSEEVYWYLYRSPGEARERLAAFRDRYNQIRPHWALRPVQGGDIVTPEDVYVHGVDVDLPRWQKWARAAKQRLDELLERDLEAREVA